MEEKFELVDENRASHMLDKFSGNVWGRETRSTIRYDTTRYDTKEEFNLDSKAEDQLNLTQVARKMKKNKLNKKAVLSQRWPRGARYISRSWALAQIWPFEIIQDGGGRHLEFIRIENSAVRSGVPENPTL